MWPLKIDMSKDECRGALRRLGELKQSKNGTRLDRIFFTCECEKEKPKQQIKNAYFHFDFAELEAYSSVVSTFRAQGSLDGYKQNVLDQLRKVFNISEDRHKAEVRRVANSEKLTTISEL